jgi:hypothetical protein
MSTNASDSETGGGNPAGEFDRPVTSDMAYTPDGPPPDAEEKVLSRWPDGARQYSVYRIAGEQVWYRNWDEAGNLSVEGGLQGRLPHGPYRYWHDNGKLCEESFFVGGKEHGVSRQWDRDGKLIGIYMMDHGTGIDQWFQAPGILAEEREWLDGEKHGVERDYFSYSEPGTLSEERYYKRFVEHGIHRSWNTRGGMRRGYPRYFIDGQRVTKRQYLRAAAKDPTLPPFRPEDNINRRQPLQPFHPLPEAGTGE